MLISNVNMRPGGIRTTFNPMSFKDSYGTWTRVCAEQRAQLPQLGARARDHARPPPHALTCPPAHRVAAVLRPNLVEIPSGFTRTRT